VPAMFGDMERREVERPTRRVPLGVLRRQGMPAVRAAVRAVIDDPVGVRRLPQRRAPMPLPAAGPANRLPSQAPRPPLPGALLPGPSLDGGLPPPVPSGPRLRSSSSTRREGSALRRETSARNPARDMSASTGSVLDHSATESRGGRSVGAARDKGDSHSMSP